MQRQIQEASLWDRDMTDQQPQLFYTNTVLQVDTLCDTQGYLLIAFFLFFCCWFLQKLWWPNRFNFCSCKHQVFIWITYTHLHLQFYFMLLWVQVAKYTAIFRIHSKKFIHFPPYLYIFSWYPQLQQAPIHTVSILLENLLNQLCSQAVFL